MRKDQPETHLEEESLGTAALVGLTVFFHFGTEQGMGGGQLKKSPCGLCVCICLSVSH